MALIECFECKQSISSMAPACIHCGAPTGTMQAAKAEAKQQETPISFGRLPTNESVPRVRPAAFGRQRKPEAEPQVEVPVVTSAGPRPVELWLKIMVFLLPPFFVWFLLRPGHSNLQRLIGFGWMGFLIALSRD
ncbi:hypothetical protein DKY63_12985 [Pseudomonas putida]|uniref:Uncharacterized protein n=1 Tax=Pseudomonas putida TaxID=303 RepID=A0A2Z4RII2_PSEPU|nr:hypothetical protein [Pseudomonas putida]AWY40757.1 hypothetical protein DKY63_12985 [Pseudomonas putida]